MFLDWSIIITLSTSGKAYICVSFELGMILVVTIYMLILKLYTRADRQIMEFFIIATTNDIGISCWESQSVVSLVHTGVYNIIQATLNRIQCLVSLWRLTTLNGMHAKLATRITEPFGTWSSVDAACLGTHTCT